MLSLRPYSVFLFGALALFAHVAAAKFKPLSETPIYPYDSNTTPYCSYWFDSDGSLSCQDLYDIFALNPTNFIRWVIIHLRAKEQVSAANLAIESLGHSLVQSSSGRSILLR